MISILFFFSLPQLRHFIYRFRNHIEEFTVPEYKQVIKPSPAKPPSLMQTIKALIAR